MSTLAVPESQCMAALARANVVRLARAELKHRVNRGETTVAEVVLSCPWEAASMSIGELLLAQRRWGETRMSTFLAKGGMSASKTVGSMTDRQRKALAAML
jgi:hypothetical protein